MLTDPTAKECLVEWELEARETVARWRAEIARLPRNGRTTQFVQELREQSPDFAGWWEEHQVLEHRARIRRFRHPKLGERSLRIVPMKSPHFTTAAVIFHLPVS
jgi:hypothetical protein